MKALRFLPLLLMFSVFAAAKDQPIVFTWPENGQPVLRISLGKFLQVSSVQNENFYRVEVLAENLSQKPIRSASFLLYAFDKGKVRIGQGTFFVDDLQPLQSVRTAMDVRSVGIPASISITPKEKVITTNVFSVPPGANLMLDGKNAGTTPRLIELTLGEHLLEYSKDGYGSGKYRFLVSREDLAGGSISFDLPSLANDVVELRDGTLITGDLITITATNVIIRVSGKDGTYDRNLVKKVMLVERVPAPIPAKN